MGVQPKTTRPFCAARGLVSTLGSPKPDDGNGVASQPTVKHISALNCRQELRNYT